MLNINESYNIKVFIVIPSLDSILNLTQHYKGVFILKNLSNYFGLTEDDIKQLVIDKVMKN